MQLITQIEHRNHLSKQIADIIQRLATEDLPKQERDLLTHNLKCLEANLKLSK